MSKETRDGRRDGKYKVMNGGRRRRGNDGGQGSEIRTPFGRLRFSFSGHLLHQSSSSSAPSSNFLLRISLFPFLFLFFYLILSTSSCVPPLFFFYIFACPCFRLSFLYFFRMDSVSHLPSLISSNLSHIFCFSSPCYSPYIAPLSFPLPSLTSKLRQVSDMAFFLCLLSIALMYLFSLCNCLFII